ncbi:hypothetical protein KRX54_00930 [Actinomycetaceae bacterium TAE3-ERU4]|nr:hypothetical protein [Actinomycetaceae bacterium TAE3-ERU4]
METPENNYNQRRPRFADDDDLLPGEHTLDSTSGNYRSSTEGTDGFSASGIPFTGFQRLNAQGAKQYLVSRLALIPLIILSVYLIEWTLVTLLYSEAQGISVRYINFSSLLVIITYPLMVLGSWLGLFVLRAARSQRGIAASTISLFLLLIYPLFSGFGIADGAMYVNLVWWYFPLILALIGVGVSGSVALRPRG